MHNTIDKVFGVFAVLFIVGMTIFYCTDYVTEVKTDAFNAGYIRATTDNATALMENQSKTFMEYAGCPNCGAFTSIGIPRGTCITPDLKYEGECSRCGVDVGLPIVDDTFTLYGCKSQEEAQLDHIRLNDIWLPVH